MRVIIRFAAVVIWRGCESMIIERQLFGEGDRAVGSGFNCRFYFGRRRAIWRVGFGRHLEQRRCGAYVIVRGVTREEHNKKRNDKVTAQQLDHPPARSAIARRYPMRLEKSRRIIQAGDLSVNAECIDPPNDNH